MIPSRPKQQETPVSSGLAVDLALVLAVDCSSSIDDGDFRLQMDGIAAALRHPSLPTALAAGPCRQIALALVHWSSAKSQAVAVPWRVLAGHDDLVATAREVETVERRWRPGGTGLAAAVDFTAALLAALPIAATRHVIDVSGDGEDNEAGNVARARDDAIERGITINGLPILNGSRQLEPYYRHHVIGGAGAFLVPADYIRSFRDAMARKLLREVTGERTT
jgi:hypothetical protein